MILADKILTLRKNSGWSQEELAGKGWSFYTNDWGFTWVVWPVAALLFTGVSSILHVLKQ